MQSIPAWALHLVKAVAGALLIFGIWFIASKTSQGNKYIAPRATAICIVVSLYAAFHIIKFVATLVAAFRAPRA